MQIWDRSHHKCLDQSECLKTWYEFTKAINIYWYYIGACFLSVVKWLKTYSLTNHQAIQFDYILRPNVLRAYYHDFYIAKKPRLKRYSIIILWNWKTARTTLCQLFMIFPIKTNTYHCLLHVNHLSNKWNRGLSTFNAGWMTDLKCEIIYVQMVDIFARENEIQELNP